jgi:hypothetical protein
MLAATAVLLMAATSCGGVTTSRQDAKKQATTRTCDRFDQCMLIGSQAGASYPTREACELAWSSNWDMAWPVAECEDKINQSQLETCYAAISGTACNLGDFLITLGKCGKVNVCIAPAGTADGGS